MPSCGSRCVTSCTKHRKTSTGASWCDKTVFSAPYFRKTMCLFALCLANFHPCASPPGHGRGKQCTYTVQLWRFCALVFSLYTTLSVNIVDNTHMLCIVQWQVSIGCTSKNRTFLHTVGVQIHQEKLSKTRHFLRCETSPSLVVEVRTPNSSKQAAPFLFSCIFFTLCAFATAQTLLQSNLDYPN